MKLYLVIKVVVHCSFKFIENSLHPRPLIEHEIEPYERSYHVDVYETQMQRMRVTRVTNERLTVSGHFGVLNEGFLVGDKANTAQQNDKKSTLVRTVMIDHLDTTSSYNGKFMWANKCRP